MDIYYVVFYFAYYSGSDGDPEDRQAEIPSPSVSANRVFVPYYQ